jgi:hypothetical protein
MRKQVLATAVLVLAAGVATGARAIEHKASHGGTHVRNLHVAGMHSGHRHRARHAGVHGPESWRENSADVRGGFIDLGPLGITAACGSYRSGHGYCGPGYSVSAWSY